MFVYSITYINVNSFIIITIIYDIKSLVYIIIIVDI